MVVLQRLPSSAFFEIFVVTWVDFCVAETHLTLAFGIFCTDMRLGSLAEFRFLDSPCQLYCVSRVDAKEDDQDFRLLDSAIYSFEAIMFLLSTEGSFHCSGTHTGKFLFDSTDGCCGFSLFAFLRK